MFLAPLRHLRVREHSDSSMSALEEVSADMPSDGADTLAEVERLLGDADDVWTEHDDADVFAGDSVIEYVDVGGDEEENHHCLLALHVEHLAVHLPKLPGCVGC